MLVVIKKKSLFLIVGLFLVFTCVAFSGDEDHHSWGSVSHAHPLELRSEPYNADFVWHYHHNSERMDEDHNAEHSQAYLDAHNSQAAHDSHMSMDDPSTTPRETQTTRTRSETPDQEVERDPVETPSRTVTEVLERILDDVKTNVPDDIEAPCVEKLVPFDFWHGYNFHTLPVLPDSVTTIADLWDYYDFVGNGGGEFHIVIDGMWHRYDGNGDVGEIPLTPHQGLLVTLKGVPAFNHLTGCPVKNQASITLNAGMSLVGFPVVPQGYVLPSDFLAHDSIDIILVTKNGAFKAIGRAGDDGDVPLVDGQSLLFIATSETELQFSVSLH